jgi:hypothetical protein
MTEALNTSKTSVNFSQIIAFGETTQKTVIFLEINSGLYRDDDLQVETSLQRLLSRMHQVALVLSTGTVGGQYHTSCNVPRTKGQSDLNFGLYCFVYLSELESWSLEKTEHSLPLQSVSYTQKGKAVPLHAMEALGGRGGIAPTHSRPRQLHAPAALYPRGKDPRYPLDRRLGGPQSRSGHGG